ncbi:MAG TPA: hypothetical protein PK402_11200, partial [Tepidisphaeraceae bacterium]|nr:hypothetical protein [Tepidisphaeraceae bacterium]
MSNNARKIRPKAYLARAIGLALGLLPVSLFGQVTGSWNVDASGNWTTTTNWNSDPNYPRDGGTAAFGMAASAPVTVTLDVDVTLAGLTFAGANQYTIAAM